MIFLIGEDFMKGHSKVLERPLFLAFSNRNTHLHEFRKSKFGRLFEEQEQLESTLVV